MPHVQLHHGRLQAGFRARDIDAVTELDHVVNAGGRPGVERGAFHLDVIKAVVADAGLSENLVTRHGGHLDRHVNVRDTGLGGQEVLGLDESTPGPTRERKIARPELPEADHDAPIVP